MNNYMGNISRRQRLVTMGAAGLGIAGRVFSNIHSASAQALTGTRLVFRT